MNEPINVTRTDLGIIDGWHIWQVVNADTGEHVGYDAEALDVEDLPTE